MMLSMSLPPPARALAEEIGDDLFGRRAWTAMVTGGPGTGKTTLLNQLAERARRERVPWIRVSPTSSDLDGPANALAQGAASMRELGVNGVLDPIFDPRMAHGRKIEAFGLGLEQLQDSIILVDLPDSWARPSRTNADGGTVAFGGHRVVQEVLDQRNGHRIVLASRHSLDTAKIDQTFRLQPGDGLVSLASLALGEYQSCASELRERVREHDLQKLTPLELRVAVALQALNVPDLLIESACRGGWAELRRRLQRMLQHKQWLKEAFFVLSHARVKLGERLLGRLLALCKGEDETASRAILDGILLMPEGPDILFHRRLHEIDTQLDADRKSQLAEATNRELAMAWETVASRDSWVGVIAWWESLHHWAETGEEDKLAQIPDVSMWTTLGRRRSLLGDYETAVRAFRRALALQPDDSYAHEYLAYNLDLLGEGLVEAERSFRRATDLDRANPWWNRRLVQALQRRGKIDKAWDAWISALDNIAETANPGEWLQRNLHLGVCQGFLDRGQVEHAADVLDSVPREYWISEFERLWNSVCHRREAQRLDASVFPEDLEFDDRWRGPRFESDIPPERWFPGRVIAMDAEELELELALPPIGDEDPEIFGLVLGIDEFRVQAQLPATFTPRLNLFVEVHVYADADQAIFVDFDPPRRREHLSREVFDLLHEFRP